MTVAALLDRSPAELGQPVEQVADAARLVIARRVMVREGIDELLVLGADPPALRPASRPWRNSGRAGRGCSMTGCVAL